MFYQIVQETLKKVKFKLLNFVIMSNHIHFEIKPHKSTNLSKIMQLILSKFAIRFNRYFSRKGHVFYDRFHSVVIKNREQMIRVFNYIADNPVKAGLAKKPTDYKYSGITFILNGIFDILVKPKIFILESYFNRI